MVAFWMAAGVTAFESGGLQKLTIGHCDYMEDARQNAVIYWDTT